MRFAVVSPAVLKKFGKSIYKKLWKIAVYTGLCKKETPIETATEIFIQKIETMNKNMQIGTKIDEIKEEDISSLAQTAEREANPLYPVPVLWTAKQLEDIYFEIKKD